MRLGCPNCGAQYEVADDLIPREGRDVQCSACGHTWFAGQGPVDAVSGAASAAARPAVAPPRAAPPPPAPRPATPPPPRPATPPQRPAGTGAAPQMPPVADWDDDGEEDFEDEAPAAPRPAAAPPDAARAATPDPDVPDPLAGIAAIMAAQAPAAPPPTGPGSAPTAAPSAAATSASALPDPQDPALAAVSAMVATQRSSLSEAAAAVLREEAARERAVRRGDGAPRVETQPELALDTVLPPEEQRAEEARRRLARLQGQPAPPLADPVTAAAAPRRDLFPDIEEINSTLRSTADRAAPEMVIFPEDVEHRTGRRVGFSTVLLIFAILALAYVFAGRISQAVPQLAPVLDRYVVAVNDTRLWLDLKLQAALAAMTSGQDGATTPAPDAVPQTLPEAMPQSPAPEVGDAPDLAPAPATDPAPAP